MAWNFHVYDSQGNIRYDMIIGRDIFPELQIYLCLSDNTIRGNGGTHEGCTAPMKAVTNSMSSPQYHNGTLWKKELWESEHVLYATRCTRHILDNHYEKYDICKVTSFFKR